MKRILKNVGVVFALASTSAVFADTGLFFNVVATGSTMTIRTTIPGHTYPAAGIKLNSSGYSIVSGCTPYSNGYCLFTVSDTMPATIVVAGSPVTSVRPTLCLNGKGPLSCQNTSSTTGIAYVSNFNTNSVLLCSVNTSTGAVSGCTDSGAGATFDAPAGLTLNAARTRAYVVNSAISSNSVSLCTINPTTRALSCSDSGGNNFNRPANIVLNSAGDAAYITNVTLVSSDPNYNRVTTCTVNPDGTLSSCGDSGAGAVFVVPAGITINAAETRAYVTNAGNDTVRLCPIISSGVLGACTNTFTGFNRPVDIILNTAETRAYVVNSNNNTISVCDVDGSGLLTCIDSGGTGFNNPSHIDLSWDETRAYVTNFTGNTVSICNVDSTTGLLSGCKDSGGTGFNGPYDFALS